ncbi:MAG: hypothetical protein DGJ47_001071, partial [Rickettsiaceae bacterium]
TSMLVKDNVEKKLWRVSNVPLAFALPVGIVEEVGHAVTGLYEKAFVSVSSSTNHFDYYNYGSIFGARLAKEVMEAKIRDPEVLSNMHHFVKRCVVLPAMIGTQFTKEELVSTKDMWSLISSRAGTFARSPMTINGKKQTPSPTCKEAVRYFEDKFEEAFIFNLSTLASKITIPGRRVKMQELTAKHQSAKILNNNIKNQITELYGADNSVKNIINHGMMVNALNDYRSSNYTMAKTKMQHESGGLINGDLASHMLTKLLAVMKNIVYGSFIFVVPLMIMTGGMSKYKSWIIGVFSLQLWPPIYAMLNMIVDYAYDPAQIVSYSAWSNEVQKFDSIASVAANLSLMVPFLALWLTNMGSGGLMHLAGSLMSSASSATSAASAERTSGGRSFDNTSIGNINRDNVSANKYDDTQQYFSGVNTMISRDGSTAKILPGGEMVHFGGVGTTSSTGEASYHLSDGISASLQEDLNKENQIMYSEQAALDSAIDKQVSEESSALISIQNATKTDKGYSIDTSTEQGKELSKHLTAIDSLTDQNGADWNKNARVYVRAEVQGGTPLKGLIGSSASLAVGGEGSYNTGYSGSNTTSNQITSDQNVGINERNTARSAKNEAFLESIGIDKNQQESLRESYSETSRLNKSISEHQNNSEAIAERMNYVENHGSEYSKDMYQDVANFYQQRYGTSSIEAQKAVSEGSLKAREIFRQLSSYEVDKIKSNISLEGNKVKSSNNVDGFHNKTKINSDVDSKVNSWSKGNGIIDHKTATMSIDKTKMELQEEFEISQDIITDKNQEITYSNITKQGNMKKKRK